MALNKIKFLFFFMTLFLLVSQIYTDTNELDNQRGALPKNGESSPKRYALIIANHDYTHWDNEIPDRLCGYAREIEKELTETGFKVQFKENVGSSELKEILQNFIFNDSIGGKDDLFIWYAGHGYSVAQNNSRKYEGFLIPVDAPPLKSAKFGRSVYLIRNVDALMRSPLAKAKRIYFVCDAYCRSSDLVSGIQEGREVLFWTSQKFGSRQFISLGGIRNKGVFFSLGKFFIESLRGLNDADSDHNKYLTANEFGAFVESRMRSKCETVSGNCPLPLYGYLEGSPNGDFHFKIRKKDNSFNDIFYVNGNEVTGPSMVIVPSGTFKMGDLNNKGGESELPVHDVSIDSFAISSYEITFDDYEVFLEDKEFHETRSPKLPDDNGWGRRRRPVINVSWNDAVLYCRWLSSKANGTYRLPTEAEWEYMARGWSQDVYPWGDKALEGYANYDFDKNGIGKTEEVGTFKSERSHLFGIFDTVGNVEEWTASKFSIPYNGDELKVLKGSKYQPIAIRGGSWKQPPEDCRSASRRFVHPGRKSNTIGFRVVKEL